MLRAHFVALLLVLSVSALLIVAVDAADSSSSDFSIGLMHFYDSLGGPRWYRQDNWGTTGDACQWFGIRCRNSVVVALSLPGNNLRGSIPEGFFTRDIGASLEEFNVSSNAISGQLPDYMFDRFDRLSLMDVSYNAFTGSFPTSLSAALWLQTVRARSNKFSGPVPAISGTNAALHVVDMGQNRLTGPFPASYGVAGRSLHTLLLDENYVADSTSSLFASSETGLWRSALEVLDASNNYLVGSIPVEVGKFTRLRVLKLDGNRIYGTLPSQIENLTALETLSLAHNYLRGPLPCAGPRPWFSNMTPFPSLRFLDISDNDLDGEVCEVHPESSIKTLRLAENSFSGLIPRIAGRQLEEVTLGGANKWHCDLPHVSEVAGWVDVAPSTTCVEGASDDFPSHQLPASAEDIFAFSIILASVVAAPFLLALAEASGVQVLSRVYRIVHGSGIFKGAGDLLQYEDSGSDIEADAPPAAGERVAADTGEQR